jgi:flagellar biosynthesis protein FlhF
MSEALSRVKQELGREAVIVRTRSLRKGWLWGWLGGRRLWEVTASGNLELPPADDEGDYRPAPIDVEEVPKEARKVPHVFNSSVTEEVGRIRQIVEALLAMQGGPQPQEASTQLKELRLQMARQEVGEDLAEELISELSLQLTGQQAGANPRVKDKLQEIIAQRVVAAEPPAGKGRTGRARVSAFIGPTGVGKTTTIAKLAANFKLRERRKVGMVTIDTYRIAAVDQLKTYAELVEVPLHVVLTPGELCRAIDLMSDCDVVLIDTAGRSQNDRLRLNQLAGFLRAAEPDDVSLVLSATSSRSAVVSTLERFMPLGVNGIVMTKLDEAIALGSVLNVAAVSRLPIRYVTTGQDVPDDIFPADPARLAKCILEGSPYVA